MQDNTLQDDNFCIWKDGVLEIARLVKRRLYVRGFYFNIYMLLNRSLILLNSYARMDDRVVTIFG